MKNMRIPEDKPVMMETLALLYAVHAYCLYRDFITANPDGKKYDKHGNELPCVPYKLSSESLKAKEMFSMAQKIVWSDDSEARINAYLSSLRDSGFLDESLEWEKEKPSRYNKNTWRSKC